MILNGITNACVGTSEVKQILLGTYVIWQNGQPVVVYEVMCSGTISEYTGHAPSVWCYSTMKWYMRTVGGNYREYGIYAIGKPQDPYIGELASDNGHEWEYTASGWVDLGELTSRLPAGYTELEYVDNVNPNSDSSNVAAFQTDYYPNAATKLSFKMQTLFNTEHGRICGSGAWNSRTGFNVNYEVNSTGPFRIHWLGTTGWSVSNKNGDFNPHVYLIDRNMAYIDGDLVLQGSTPTYSATDPMSIFNYTEGGSLGISQMHGRMFYFDIYDDDVLVNSLVPAKRDSDNVVGAYDIVNNVFMASANNNVFYAGPDVGGSSYPVEYTFKGEPDIEGMDYKVMITGSIEDYTGSEGKVYVIPEEKWYIRTIGGNYTEYGIYAKGKPQDPYIGELATDNGHEWEYTSSGWVDLGEASPVVIPEGYTEVEFVGNASGSSYTSTAFEDDYTTNANIRVETKIKLEGITQYGRLFGLKQYSWSTAPAMQLDYETGSNGTIQASFLGVTAWTKNTNIPIDLLPHEYIYKVNEVYRDGDLVLSAETPSTTYAGGNFRIFTANNINSNEVARGLVYYFRLYDNNVLVREYLPVKRNSDDKAFLYDTVTGNLISLLNGGNGYVGPKHSTIGTLPKEYTELDPPEPIDTIYATAADEYLKSNDNYYCKDYIDNLYQCGAYEETSEYVQGDQLTPIYVQGQIDDFIVYEGGRYYKNYIYVQPVDQQLATGDYVRGDYIGTADVLVSGLTNSSTAFNVNIDDTATPVTIGSSSGSNYEWRVYGDLSKSVSVRNFALNNKNLVTCHFLVSGITDTYGCFSNCYNLKEASFVRGITSFGQWAFYSCRSLTSVNIPSSVTSIGQEAFKNCWEVTSIIIPDSVTTIGISAFENCKSLTSLNIPSSVTSIANNGPSGWQIVTGCSKLTSLTVDANNPVYDSRDNCNAIIHTATNVLWMGSNTTVIPNTVTRIAQGAFTNNGIIESMTIPNSVTSLGQYAFFSCVNLKTITIPSSVTSIDDDCFRNDVNTVFHFEATTPPTLNGSSVFQYGYGVIYVPVGTAETYKAANNWGNYASRIYEEGETFSTAVKGTAVNNGNSINLYFNGSTTRYYASVTGHNQDGTCNFICEPPAGVTSIGANYATSIFSYSNNIVTIDFSGMPNTCTAVTIYAFYQNSSITSVILPNSVTSIGQRAFHQCTSLPSITIPSSVTTIGQEAFYYCSSLQIITIPSSVTTIGQEAFYGCTNTVFHIQSTTPPTLESSAFNGGYGIICVPVGTAETYKTASGWSSYADKIYEEGTDFSTMPIQTTGSTGYMKLYFGTSTPVYGYSYAAGKMFMDVPLSTTEIGYTTSGLYKSACSGYADFTGLVNLTTIRGWCFRETGGIKRLTFPSSLTTIGNQAFQSTGTVEFVFYSTTPPTLASNAFGATNPTIYVPDESVSTYKGATNWRDLSTYIKPISELPS